MTCKYSDEWWTWVSPSCPMNNSLNCNGVFTSKEAALIDARNRGFTSATVVHIAQTSEKVEFDESPVIWRVEMLIELPSFLAEANVTEELTDALSSTLDSFSLEKITKV